MTTVSAGVASPADGLVCFVCDGNVIGRYYNLASCKTQVTKQRLVEKLGLLVGEQYMVVVSEDDIICRSCTTMLNNLDRLEKEMSSVRSVILRFLEKKYELEDGELFNSKIVLPAPTSQPDIMQAFKKSSGPITFQERKNQSAKALVDSEGKSNVWMQCDRCKYTTPYSSFMINHIHKHSQLNKPDNKPKAEPPPSQEETEIVEDLQEELHTVMPVTNLTEAVVPDLVEKMKPPLPSPETAVIQGNQVLESEVNMGEDVVEMDMGVENVENGMVCMVDENGMVLQKVPVQQTEDGQFYVVEGDDDNTKQMLSVTEDGTVQMVQVMWDDIADAVSADNQIQF